MPVNIFRLYEGWTCLAWFSFLALGMTLEVMGLFRFKGAIPLTWLIRDSLPEWLRWMLLGWLLYHFGILTNRDQPFK